MIAYHKKLLKAGKVGFWRKRGIDTESKVITGFGPITGFPGNPNKFAHYNFLFDELNAFEHNGSTVDYLGIGLSISTSDAGAMAGLDTDSIAWIRPDNANLQMMTFNFSTETWSTTGSPVNASTDNNERAIIALNSTYVVLQDENNLFQNIRVWKYNGSTWVTETSSYQTGHNNIRMCRLNDSQFLIGDRDNDEWVVYTLENATITQESISLPFPGDFSNLAFFDACPLLSTGDNQFVVSYSDFSEGFYIQAFNFTGSKFSAISEQYDMSNLIDAQDYRVRICNLEDNCILLASNDSNKSVAVELVR